MSDLKVVADRLYALESRSGAPVEPSSPNQCQEEEDDTLSMAPGSQKASFLTVEEEPVPTTSVSKKYVSSALNRAGTPEKVISSESESEEFLASRDQLKARVYSLLREKAHVPFDSPPRIQKLCPRLRRRVVCLRNFPLLTSLFLNLSMFPQLFK
jgi:hypothetical protein